MSKISPSPRRERLLAGIVTSAMDAIITIDERHEITLANPAAGQLFGYSVAELLGKPISVLIPERFRDAHGAHIRHFARTKVTNRGVGRFGQIIGLRADGREFPVDASIAQLEGAQERLLTVTLRDATQRIEAERALRQNYELLDRIFATTHFCIVYLDRDLNFVRVNRAYAEACGHPPEFFAGKNHFELYPGETAEAIFRNAVATGEPFTIHANPFRYSDQPERGVTYWDWTLHPLRNADGAVDGLLFALLDVTARTRATQELERKEEALRGYAGRLRELSYRLRTVEETERRAISRELHDRIGQELSTLGLILGSLGVRLPQESLRAVEKQLQDMQSLLKTMVANVRDVMAELRPSVLDDYGLLAALRQLASEFAQRSGIAAELSGVDLPSRLPMIVETAMFRIIQEALNNIAKHAQAKHVEISLHEASGRVMLDIADDGIGFDTNAAPPDKCHWGLTTMRERAEAVGIALRLESDPGAGTRIVLEVERTAI